MNRRDRAMADRLTSLAYETPPADSAELDLMRQTLGIGAPRVTRDRLLGRIQAGHEADDELRP